MDLFLNILLLLLGFFMLVKGADLFVDGSSAVAKIMKIPSIIVGVTVVSLGTSLPEFAVSTAAAIKGSNEIALSNVLGSNLFNLLVVLGATAVLASKPVPVKRSLLKMEFPLNFIMTGVLGIMTIDYLIKGGIYENGNLFTPANGSIKTGVIGRMDGIIILAVFIIFMVLTVKAALKARREAADEEVGDVMPMWKAAVFIVIGAVAIKFGGDFVVSAATVIAGTFGMSETLIGLTIVACGTSLPELVTSVVAAKKDECDLAVGNVIGSNLFNILFILGLSTTIHPVEAISSSVVDIIVLFVMGGIAYLFAFTKDSVNRKEGLVMVATYVVYLVYIIMR